MAVHALINKEVIPYICAGKKVTIEYLHNSTHFQTEKLAKWLDITDSTPPIILQAKMMVLFQEKPPDSMESGGFS